MSPLPDPLNPQKRLRANRFIKACRGEDVDRTPVWIMRQAGRYLPEYRQLRQKAGDFLTLCKTPELAAQVTLQPVDRLGVDAAIIFSDILIPVEAMGVPLQFSDGEGPQLEPVRTEEAINELRVPDADEATGFVMQTIRSVVRTLDGKVPVIGFAGAPWTLFCYAVEGKTSKGFPQAKRMLFEAPAMAHALLEKLTRTTIGYLEAQVKAGAKVVQLFDSWAGALGPEEYVRFELPYVRRIIQAMQPLDVPVIYFANEGAGLLTEAKAAGASVLGVDFRVPLDDVRRILGEGVTDEETVLQGNLDNCALFAPPEVIDRRVADVIRRGGKRHIFNLGHGILPGTPVEHAIAMVESVHRHGQRATAAATATAPAPAPSPTAAPAAPTVAATAKPGAATGAAKAPAGLGLKGMPKPQNKGG